MKKLFLLAFAVFAVTMIRVTPAVAAEDDLGNLMSAEEIAQDMEMNVEAEPSEDAAAFSGGVRPIPFPRPFPHPRPWPRPMVSCHAQNIRGQVFSATGYDAFFTQNQAVANCQAFSLRCSPIGCNYVF